MNQSFVQKAEDSTPPLYETEIRTGRAVCVTADDGAPFGAGVREVQDLPKDFGAGDRFVLDFGQHCVGRLSFRMERSDRYLDAPVRLKLRFGEIPMELLRNFSEYHGSLCASWLQEEIVTVDRGGTVALPRRYCFRYVEVTVLNTPRRVRLFDFTVRHTSSAKLSNDVAARNIQDPVLAAIDRIGTKTLADCMQNVYEDGPKRDRRLWSGDLRLQALTDYSVYQNHSLVRRCLYLFAACEEEGKYLPGCLYSKPELFYDDGMGIMDYALLYTVILCEYYEHTQDLETARELFPVARRQIDLTIATLDREHIVTLPSGWAGFIDWVPGLQLVTAEEGVFLFALEKNIVLARAVGDPETAERWERELERSRKIAYRQLFDAERNAFLNSYDRFQYSVHAQVWMILGGVIGGEQARSVLRQALCAEDCLQPVTPYMHHYIVEAMIRLDMKSEALEYIRNYWGSMVQLGADTFWEVYVKDDLNVSPYGDILINSYCHAWSCTPSYFIRKYFSGSRPAQN